MTGIRCTAEEYQPAVALNRGLDLDRVLDFILFRVLDFTDQKSGKDQREGLREKDGAR